MNDNKFWLTLWLGLAIAITGIIISCTYRSYQNDEKMAQMGFCKTTVMGSGYLVWTKCAEAK